jgi:hypothetical protein
MTRRSEANWLAFRKQPEKGSPKSNSKRGSLRPPYALRRAGKGGVALRAAVSVNADQFAADLAPVIANLHEQGVTTLRQIFAALNSRGVLTRRGGRWHVSNVRNLLARIAQTAGVHS